MSSSDPKATKDALLKTTSSSDALAKATKDAFHRVVISKLHDSYLQGRNTDITFKVGNQENFKEFKAMKSILCSTSPYFETMFSKKWDTKPVVTIPDDDPATFGKLMDFLHGGNLPNDVLETVALLSLADKYVVDELALICRAEISTQTSSKNRHNLLQVYAAAERFHVQPVMDTTFLKIINHFEYISNIPEFINVDKGLLLKLVSENKLSVNEDIICSAAVKWLSYNIPVEAGTSPADVPFVKDVMQHIQFQFVTPICLKNTVRAADVLSSEALVQAFCQSVGNTTGRRIRYLPAKRKTNVVEQPPVRRVRVGRTQAGHYRLYST